VEQLAVRIGNIKLIYQDILCMSQATVLDRGNALKRLISRRGPMFSSRFGHGRFTQFVAISLRRH